MKDLTIESAIREIEDSGFECPAGPLRNNVTWQWIKERLRDHDDLTGDVPKHDPGC